MKHKFEKKLDLEGARKVADQMASDFTNMTGIELNFSHFYINSPRYGYIDKLEDFPKDDKHSLFVFQFSEADNSYESINMIPSLDKVMVWRSLNDDNPYNMDGKDGGPEGAVNPDTGFADWEDELEYGSYPLLAWANYHRMK